MDTVLNAPRLSSSRFIYGILIILIVSIGAFAQTQQVVLGSSQIQTSSDTNDAGIAEVFPVTASSSGQVSSLFLFVDGSNTASTIVVGVYTSYHGRPSTLLSQAVITKTAAGQWNSVQIPTVQVTAKRQYWLAVLGLNGQIQFRDRSYRWCYSQTNAQTNLTSLPTSWERGTWRPTCLISMFGSGATLSSVSVSISPSTASIQPAQQFQFTSAVSGTTNTAATWTASGGTVTSTGMYTAPSTAGTYTVTATSAADATKSATATVTVSQPVQVSISVSPTSTSLQSGQQSQFTAAVSGTTNTATTWTASAVTVTNT